jgi:small subunit ribosomal protein S3e
MESGAKGCEVVVSGKLRGQRAKSMKFVDGLMIHSGEPTNDYVDTATRHVLLRQGMYMYIAYCVVFYVQKASGFDPGV